MRIYWFFIWKNSPKDALCQVKLAQWFWKFKSLSPKDALCQVWLKLAQRFWRRFLNFVNEILLFRKHLSLEKGMVLHLNKLESPSPNSLCHVWLKLAQWFWRRRWKCEKFMVRRTTGNQKSHLTFHLAHILSTQSNIHFTSNVKVHIHLTFHYIVHHA